MKRRCFTLSELVVLVLLLAVMAVLLLYTLGCMDKRRKARQLRCITNLNKLQEALCMYGDDNRSYLPDKDNAPGLATLLRLNYINDTRLFVCPGTKDTPAENWQALMADGDRHCSYAYKGALYMNDLTPQTIILQDKPGNHRRLQHSIMGDFSVVQRK